jgi:hypothetical protein
MAPAPATVYRSLRQVVEPLGAAPAFRNDHFDLHYRLRNPRAAGAGLGLMGVENDTLIRRYAEALEKTYNELRDRGWEHPTADPGQRIRVYVFDTTRFLQGGRDAPFTYPDPTGPVIGLRSVISEPDLATMLARADIEAAHELTHVFNHHVRRPDPYTLLESSPWRCDPWQWFDEATAVFMERQVFPEHTENLRFALHWAYQPELELELPYAPGGYCAAWFIEYLVKTFGWEFLHGVWHDHDPTERGERPVNVIDRLLGARHNGLTFQQVFAGEGRANPGEQQRRRELRATWRRPAAGPVALLAALGCEPPGPEGVWSTDPGCCCERQPGDFCDDNYCTRAYSVHCFARGVHVRFGGRSITERLNVPVGTAVQLQSGEPLGPLSCRYFQMYPDPAGKCHSAHVRVTIDVAPDACRLHAALMPLADTRQCGPTVHLRRPDGASPARTVLAGTVDFPPCDDGHAVLVVSNAYVVPARHEPGPEDWQTFGLEASGCPNPTPA